MATSKSTFGSSNARAFSVSTLQGKASSLGVSGNGGDDLIENKGAVNAELIANTSNQLVAIADSSGAVHHQGCVVQLPSGEPTSKGITAGAGMMRL
jgi:hypothetical protein